MDLYPIVLRNGFCYSADDRAAQEKLITEDMAWEALHTKNKACPMAEGMSFASFAFKRRQKGITDDVWSWKTGDGFLQVNAKSGVQPTLV